jgi:hypothetical protein
MFYINFVVLLSAMVTEKVGHFLKRGTVYYKCLLCVFSLFSVGKFKITA